MPQEFVTHEAKVPRLADDFKSKLELEWIQVTEIIPSYSFTQFSRMFLSGTERVGIIVSAHRPVCCSQGCHSLYVPKQGSQYSHAGGKPAAGELSVFTAH